MVELIEENEEQEIEVEKENTVIGGTDNYNDLSNKPSINGVQLKGNKTLEELGAQPKGDYAKKSDIPDVSNFITKTTSDLVNYYLKEETYTREEVKALVSAIPKFSIQVVDELPTSEISATTVYLVPSGDETSNVYTEYIYVNNTWEKLGTQTVDLTDYALKSEIPTNISELNNDSGFLKTEIDPTVPSYVKNITEEDIAKWNEGGSGGGGASYTSGTNIEITADNVINNTIPYKTNSSSDVVALGGSVNISGTYNVCIGKSSSCQTNTSVVVGSYGSAYQSNCVLLGYNASSSYKGAIAIGANASAKKANQCIIGSSAAKINEVAIYTDSGIKTLATTDLVTALEERVAALEAQIATLTGTE